jgi:uncharacterized protein
MQLTEHKPGNHHHIRSVDKHGLVIDDRRFTSSLIVGARLLHTDWPVLHLEDLNEQTIEPLIEHRPEVVVLGFGTVQAFPDPAIQSAFMNHGVGIECMTLDAACRTFNVLMSENRRALAGLIINPDSQA